MIKLYTLPTCGICQMIKTKLAAKNINYSEYNLEDHLEELHTDRAPVLVADDMILSSPVDINNWIKQQ